MTHIVNPKKLDLTFSTKPGFRTLLILGLFLLICIPMIFILIISITLFNPNTLMPITGDGNWPMGAEFGELWSVGEQWEWVDSDRQDQTFSQRFPAEWQQIQSHPSGQFYTPNGLFLFVTVSPEQIQGMTIGSQDHLDFAIASHHLDGIHRRKLVSYLPNNLIQSPKNQSPKNQVLQLLLLPWLGMLAIALYLFYLLIQMQGQTQAEELQIQKMSQLLNSILDALVDPFYVIDANTYQIILANQATQKLGHQSEPYTCYKLTHKRDYPCEGTHDPCPLKILRETHKPTVVEHIHFRDDGTPIIVEVHGYPIFDAEDNLIYMVEYSIDITQRRAAEEQIRKLSQAVEQSANTIIITDHNGKIEYVNPKCCQTTGYGLDELLGKSPKLFKSGKQPKEYYTNLWKTIKSGQEWRGEFCNRRKDGSLYWEQASIASLVDRTGKITHFIAVKEDITQRKATEEQLQRSQAQLLQQAQDLTHTLQELRKTQSQLIHTEKMSSLMQLVAGMAHEVNNPTNFISNNLVHLENYFDDLIELIQLYQENNPDPNAAITEKFESIEFDYLRDDFKQLVGSMQAGVQRISKIVTSLRTFSRLDEAELKRVNIHDGLESTLLLLEGLLRNPRTGTTIEITKEYGVLPPVECYAGHLNQVFMNILKNAIDALHDSQVSPPRDRIPQITIKTAIQEENQKRITIWIRDNGPGIESRILTRIFDPFFTTKPVGQGTGLGLAISYEIIQDKHQGELRCHSTPGAGTEFVITIPCDQSARTTHRIRC